MIIFKRVNNDILPSDEIMNFGWYQKMLTKYKNEMLVIKILKYCYFMGHIDSPIIEKKYKGEQAIKESKKYSELPDNVDITDPLIKQAISDIKEVTYSPLKSSIDTNIKTIENVARLCSKMEDSMNALILTGSKEDLESATVFAGNIFKLNMQIPEVIAKLKQAQLDYMSINIKKDKKKGGDDIPKSYTGDPSIEGDD